jgi:hypothetical protein
MADTRDGGFSEETEDLLRRSEKSLQQGPLVCFAAFLWVHHVHKLLSGSLEVLQLLLSLLLLFAQRLDLLKAVGELLFNISDYLLQLSHPIYKDINRAIIYAPGSSHAYIQHNYQDITTRIMK